MKTNTEPQENPSPPFGAVMTFPVIAGIDREDAFRRMGGNLALFNSLLALLIDNYEGAVEAIRRLITAGEKEEAAERLHTLRGAMASISAKEIEGLVRQTEEALQKGQESDVKDLLWPLGESIGALIAAIRKNNESNILEAPQLGGRTGADRTAFLNLLDLLADNNLTALEMFTAMRPALEERLGPVATENVRLEVEGLHFNEAISILSHANDEDEVVPPRKVVPPGCSPARILIVDDDAGTVRQLGQMVGGMGEIFFASDGSRAINMVREKQPDLMLLDMVMPGMSGYEVCKIIKDDPDFYDLPILFVTSNTDIESETKALEAGAVDYISKPPNPKVVRARVKTHLALKQRSDQLHRLASVDSLTGLANRRAFDIALDQECRRAYRSGSPLSLFMIDIDDFKRFNDQYGHLTGDDCLRAVGAKLASLARRPGELVARYGGEEFAVILPASDMDIALRLGELMRQSVSTILVPSVTARATPMVTISIGVACRMPGSVSTGLVLPGGARACLLDRGNRSGALELVGAADAALYEAKRCGKNTVVGAMSASDSGTISNPYRFSRVGPSPDSYRLTCDQAVYKARRASIRA